MALGSLACVVLWRTTEPEHRRWLWAAAALAFASASIRELGATAIVSDRIVSEVLGPSRENVLLLREELDLESFDVAPVKDRAEEWIELVWR